MDEPTSPLDPFGASKIEELVRSLKHNITIIIVTHNMLQAARVFDFTAFMYLGDSLQSDTFQASLVSEDLVN